MSLAYRDLVRLHTCMHRSSDYSMRILKRLYMVGLIMIFATLNRLRLIREEVSALIVIPAMLVGMVHCLEPSESASMET